MQYIKEIDLFKSFKNSEMHFTALLVCVVVVNVSFMLSETKAKGITEITTSENSIEYIGDHYDSRRRAVKSDDTEIIGVDRQPVVVVQFERYIFSVPRIYRRRRKKFQM